MGDWSYNKANWLPFANPLLGPQTAEGPVNGTEYTNSADFGLYIRARLEVSNISGTAIEGATLSAMLALHLIR